MWVGVKRMYENLLGLLKNGTITFPKLLFQHYKRLGLDDTQFLLVLHLHLFAEEGKSFPSIQEIEERMSLSSTQIMMQMESLIKAGFLRLEKDIDQWGKITESFDFTPLYSQLIQFLYPVASQHEQTVTKENSNLFTLFEETFGRPLSPIECEYLNQWLDQDRYSMAIIKAALNEAEVVGKLNIRYIDRILLEWSKQNITTEDEAKKFSMRFREKQYERMELKRKKEMNNDIRFPQINWLKDQSQ